MITSLSKKRKREGKSGKRERKRRKKGKKGKEKEKKGKEKEGRDGILLTQDNKQNLFGEKNHIFPQGERILYIFEM